MTDEQHIELVLLQHRSAKHPEVRGYDQDVVADRLAYLLAYGFIERRHGKAIRNHPGPSTIALSPSGQERLEHLLTMRRADGPGIQRIQIGIE